MRMSGEPREGAIERSRVFCEVSKAILAICLLSWLGWVMYIVIRSH